MELKFFPVGAYIKLRKGGAWLEITKIVGNVYYLWNDKKQLEIFRGNKTVVADWLVGKNSSSSKSIKK